MTNIEYYTTYRTTPKAMTLGNPEPYKFSSVVRNRSESYKWENMARIIYDVLICESKRVPGLWFQLQIDNEGRPRCQPVTYTVNVVISRKWGKNETMLLRTTNKKSFMAYPILPFSVTLSDLQGESHIVSLCKWDFSCSRASRGPSATAKLLVLPAANNSNKFTIVARPLQVDDTRMMVRYDWKLGCRESWDRCQSSLEYITSHIMRDNATSLWIINCNHLVMSHADSHRRHCHCMTIVVHFDGYGGRAEVGWEAIQCDRLPLSIRWP